MSEVLKVREPDTGLFSEVDFRNRTYQFTDEGGRVIKMDIGPADVHIDSALVNYAAGYKPQLDLTVADDVCPVVPVDKTSNKFYTWDKDDVYQDANVANGGGTGEVPEISPRLSSSNYSTVGYALGAFVPTELVANADTPLKIEMAYMRRVLNALYLARERRVAALLTTGTNWSGPGGYVNTLGATAKWNAGSTSDPIANIWDAVEQSITPINTMVMSERVYHSFVQNAKVQPYFQYKNGTPSDANKESAKEIQALLRLPRILVTSMKGKGSGSPVYSYVWGNNVALLYVEPGTPSDGQSISTAKTFRWTGADQAASDGSIQGGFLVRSFFVPHRGPRGGRKIVVTHNDAEVFTSVYAGALIVGAYQ